MVHQLVDVPHASRNENIQTSLTLEQVLRILFKVVHHTPTDSQLSFISMFRDNAPSFLSREASKAPSRQAHLSLLPDSFNTYLRRKTAQHLFESDLAFEAKQQAATKTSRRLGKSKGTTKRYNKPRRNQERKEQTPIMAFPLVNPHTVPYGVPWDDGGATVPTNCRTFEISSSCGPHFYHRNPTDSSSGLSTHLRT